MAMSVTPSSKASASTRRGVSLVGLHREMDLSVDPRASNEKVVRPEWEMGVGEVVVVMAAAAAAAAAAAVVVEVVVVGEEEG